MDAKLDIHIPVSSSRKVPKRMISTLLNENHSIAELTAKQHNHGGIFHSKSYCLHHSYMTAFEGGGALHCFCPQAPQT